MIPDWRHASPEVRDALGNGRGVVALESTVLTHGLPRPLNLDVARGLEAEVRAGGAVPATIAVVDGRPTVGLTDDQLQRVCTSDGVLKVSTRDLPVAMGRGATGGTTVAATAWLARAAGIDVFATGGIGGVHRGAPLDVSADLVELERTPVIVVCAGAKSILDLPATREALETRGVLVLGWKTEEFPAFYTRSSGLHVDARVECVGDVVKIWRAHQQVATPGSILVAVPIPPEDGLTGDVLDAAIEAALDRARADHIAGKALTPFLLSEIVKATGGTSLQANVALLKNNAAVAASIAAGIVS